MERKKEEGTWGGRKEGKEGGSREEEGRRIGRQAMDQVNWCFSPFESWVMET